MDLEIGQVLWLKVRYKTDIVANMAHPMLVAVIDIDDNKIEVIAIDKAREKISQLYNEANYFLDSENPKEKVIYVDSYAQLSNTLTIEFFLELIKFRKTTAKLSKEKTSFRRASSSSVDFAFSSSGVNSMLTSARTSTLRFCRQL